MIEGEKGEGSKSQQSTRMSTQTPENHYGHHSPPVWMLLPQRVNNILYFEALPVSKQFLGQYLHASYSSSLLLFVARWMWIGEDH